ncbi:MAG: radical SAM family heme chaperone HemW [Christensenellales bacterium]
MKKENNFKKEISIYVHIPFCENKCYYCDFVSFKKGSSEKEKYVKNLVQEINLNKNKNFVVKTIFIGGGTPSCLQAKDIEKILKTIKRSFCVDEKCEITIEINPNSFSKEKAEIYKKCGINRLSFGLQSANDKLLKKINRIHTKKDFVKAIKIAKLSGFENVNADILLGLAGQKLLDVKNTLKLLIKLGLPHISCYTLILEENTPLFNMVKNKKCELPSEEKVLKMYNFCLKFLAKHKIFRYEVSNFSIKGFECKHNLVYWNNCDYLGLGLNSHSKIGNQRFENFADFENYYLALSKNQKPIKNIQTLNFDEQREEFVMLGLRKTEGISLEEYSKLFGEDLLCKKAEEIELLKKNNLIQIGKDHLKATNLGFEVLNQIILSLV